MTTTVTLRCPHSGQYVLTKLPDGLYRDIAGLKYSRGERILLIGSPAEIHNALEEHSLEFVERCSAIAFGIGEDGIWAKRTPNTSGDVVQIAGLLQLSSALRVADPEISVLVDAIF